MTVLSYMYEMYVRTCIAIYEASAGLMGHLVLEQWETLLQQSSKDQLVDALLYLLAALDQHPNFPQLWIAGHIWRLWHSLAHADPPEQAVTMHQIRMRRLLASPSHEGQTLHAMTPSAPSARPSEVAARFRSRQEARARLEDAPPRRTRSRSPRSSSQAREE